MRFLVAIFFCVIAAYGFGFYLSVPANPEVKFWREVVTRREREISDLRAKDPATPILFFTGGSSCAFSIDPKIMEETCGLPAFNLGLPAAAGGRYLLHQALEQTRAGDIMVVCLEPDLLTSSANGEVGSTGASKFSFALAVAGGHPADAAGGDTFGMRPGIRDYLNFSRPGSFHIAVLGAKAFTHKGYRYTSADLRYRGRTETQVRDLAMTPAGTALATCLSTEGRELLTMFKEAAGAPSCSCDLLDALALHCRREPGRKPLQ